MPGFVAYATVSRGPVRVGLLDSGCASRLRPHAFAELNDDGCITLGRPATDTSGHGTATASLVVAAQVDGRALGEPYPNALVVGRVMDGGAVIVRILAGLDWMLDQQVEVLALCAGLPVTNPVFGPVLSRLSAAGVLIVCPSGNTGTGHVTTPGDDPSVLSVGALDRHGRRAPFSGTAYGLSLRDTRAPDVLAWGVDVPVMGLDGALARRSGTSMAAARVAAVAGWLRAQVPDATADDVRRALCLSAEWDELNEPTSDARWGCVNAVAARALLEGGHIPEVPTIRSHDEDGQRPDPRLVRQLRAWDGRQRLTGVYILSEAASLEWSEGVPALLARVGADAGHAPHLVRALPRARALVVRGPPDVHHTLIDAPEVWMASAADAHPLVDPLYNPDTGRTLLAF